MLRIRLHLTSAVVTGHWGQCSCNSPMRMQTWLGDRSFATHRSTGLMSWPTSLSRLHHLCQFSVATGRLFSSAVHSLDRCCACKMTNGHFSRSYYLPICVVLTLNLVNANNCWRSTFICLFIEMNETQIQINPLKPTVAIIFDIWALWRSVLSVRVPRCQKLQMTA